MENQRFINKVEHAEIAASTKLEIDLNDLRTTYGNNFNTLFITNTDANSAIAVYADGEEIAFITANNGSFSFDWEFGLTYNMISLENTNAGAAVAANKVKTFVGRTGA